MYTKHKAVHGPVQTFLKGLRSFILDELVRILPGLQAYYPGRDSRLPQDRNRTKCRPDPCTVTVIKKQDFLGVTFHKTCMSGGQCSSKRRHCIGKACLMHGDHIHISLTEDQIILPGGPGHIQPVKIPALIKDLRLRRIQVLGLAISHDTTSETNDPVVYIHDREDHTVPELIIHASPLIYIEQAGFPEKFITVALTLKIFVQIITVLVRISKTEFTDGFLGKTSSCQISVSRLSAFSPELIIKVLCCQLVDLQKICSLFCFFSGFSGILDLRKLYPCPVSQM